MDQFEPIAAFIRPLEKLEILYCVTGSVAAGVYGEPRFTRDLDLILMLSHARIGDFRQAFPETEFYLPPTETILAETLREQRGLFNLIHHASGFKADIFLARRDPLHRWALQHRRRMQTETVLTWLAPPEYVVLRKLEFLREGGQEKHLRDVRFIMATTVLDETFLAQELARLGLQDLWQQCQAIDP